MQDNELQNLNTVLNYQKAASNHSVCVQASSSVYHYRNIAKLYELGKWFSDLLSKFFFL